MADELEFVCEKCVHYEVCNRSSRMIWARLSKEKVCTDFMEVVRCKDCAHTETDGTSEPEIYCKKWDRWEMPEDFFCGYGKRKNAEKDN